MQLIYRVGDWEKQNTRVAMVIMIRRDEKCDMQNATAIATANAKMSSSIYPSPSLLLSSSSSSSLNSIYVS